MKALILGAEGQVGRALALTVPAGSEVVALGRAQCDVTDEAAVARAIRQTGAGLVLNAAAYTAVDRAEAEPEAAQALNADAPGLIAAAARAAGARSVHISTDFVFGGAGNRPFRPDDATAPASVYARTKLAGEVSAAAADPDALIVRSAWIHAPRGANFVTTMLRLMAERETIGVVADQIGTPTAAASLARALWALSDRGATGVWHYTDAGVASWYDFAVAVEEEARGAGLLTRPVEVRPIGTADYPTPAARPAFSVLDKTATWSFLGEAAPHWRVNLRRTIRDVA